MKKNYGLTNTELQIMELLWSEKRPMTFREIMDVAKNEWKKEWKVQTLNTFLLYFIKSSSFTFNDASIVETLNTINIAEAKNPISKSFFINP